MSFNFLFAFLRLFTLDPNWFTISLASFNDSLAILFKIDLMAALKSAPYNISFIIFFSDSKVYFRVYIKKGIANLEPNLVNILYPR